jgi:hypothetical protein
MHRAAIDRLGIRRAAFQTADALDLDNVAARFLHMTKDAQRRPNLRAPSTLDLDLTFAAENWDATHISLL